MGINISDLGPEARRQVLEKLAATEREKAERQSKFHNRKDSRGAVTFDSRKEARRYDDLLRMLHVGMIRNLKLQPQFTLQESFVTPSGKRVRAIRYVADFSYERETGPDANGQTYWLTVVEDVKSSATKTREYELKKKLLQEKFHLTITEIE